MNSKIFTAKLFSASAMALLLVSTLSIARTGFALEQSRAVFQAESALKEVERLLGTQELDASFREKFKGLAVAKAPTDSSPTATSQVTVYQHAANNGSFASLDLVLGSQEEVLSRTINASAPATSAPVWPANQDALAAAETALSSLASQAPSRPELETYRQGLTRLFVTRDPVKDAATNPAAPVAVVEILAGPSDAKLNIRLNSEGKVDQLVLAPELAPAKLSFSPVKEIFTARCVMCHSNKQKLDLTDYTAVKTNLAKLERVIVTTKRMPLGAPLTDAQFDLVKTWIQAGAPETATAPVNSAL